MKKTYLFLIFLIFLCSIAVVSATEDMVATDDLQSIEDTSLNQEEDILLEKNQESNDDTTQEDILEAEPPGTFKDLQKTIDEVPGASFSIDRDYYANDDLKTLTIDKSLEIDGKGNTLDAKGLDRIMTINLDSNEILVLRNFNFINGKLSWTNGAALNINGGTVSLINCTFKDNMGGFALSGEGGAVYAKNCKLRIINSVFDHNHFERDNNEELYGGALGVTGNGFCIISDSVFKNNIGGKGGAIWSDMSLTVERCEFINNTGLYYGGAINVYSNNADIFNCNFIDNEVYFGGSSISVAGSGSTRIDSCNFIGDRAIYPDYRKYGNTINIAWTSKSTKVIINKCTFINQEEKGSILSNCMDYPNVFADNNWWDSNDQNKYEKPRIRGDVVADDWYYLGFNNPYYMPNEKTQIELSLRSVNGNSQMSIPSIYTITNIRATNATVTQADKYVFYYEPFPDSDKGRIDLTLKYSDNHYENFTFYFLHNAKFVTVHNYDELASAIEGLKNIESKYAFINLEPGNYTATRQINLYAPGRFNIEINGNGNTVDGKGKYGFLDIETGTLTLKNINIKNFVDKCVYTVDTNLNIENCVFTNNNARERGGGAIYHHNRAYATKNLNIANSKFYNNKANNGGAVFTSGTAKTNVVNSLFDGNVAKNNGGAMVTDIGYRFTSPSSTKIDGSVFSNNKASNGGAIYQEVPLYVSNSKFINNHADKEAGAIYRNAKFEQDNVLFKNNTPQDFEYTGGADDYDEPTSNPSYRAYSTNYRSIDKITVNNRQIQIIDNKLTLDVLNQIFNKDFRNGHLLVYIDGILVFNATTTNDLLQVIFDLLNLLSGNHEIKVVFTDSNGNTNTYVENITI